MSETWCWYQNAVDNAVDDTYPFYHDISLFDSLIYKVHFNTNTVLLKGGITLSFEDVITEFNCIL